MTDDSLCSDTQVSQDNTGAALFWRMFFYSSVGIAITAAAHMSNSVYGNRAVSLLLFTVALLFLVKTMVDMTAIAFSMGGGSSE
jgi:hypothetical protein